MSEHSKLPWRITEPNERKGREIVCALGSTVAKLTALDMPNAELIVSFTDRIAELERQVAELRKDANAPNKGLITLTEAVAKVVKKHGGIRATERATGVDKAFLSRLMRGLKVDPSAETLNSLGLSSVPLYMCIDAALAQAKKEES